MGQRPERELARRANAPAVVDHGGRPLLRLPDGRVAQPKPGERVPVGRAAHAVDVCLVFDTTSSMTNKIDGLVRCMVDFVGELSRLRLDWRLTAVPFGDLRVPGDRVVDDLPFVTTREAGERLISTLPRFSGGGNGAESSLEAMMAALRKRYRRDAVTVLVLLTDEPPWTSVQVNAATVGDALRTNEVICFVAAPNRPEYRAFAEENGGRWYPIGTSMDTAALLAFLRSLITDVACTAKAVHQIGAGSVRRFLELENKRGER